LIRAFVVHRKKINRHRAATLLISQSMTNHGSHKSALIYINVCYGHDKTGGLFFD
jgi:hypothetical protein